ncbi:MAG: hypothetical protein AAGE84_29410 [Cyanobacteria bacterium P01_G01_bin.39]
MSFWQQIQETIVNTAHSTKAIAVDSVEAFHHHRALSLNKKAETIRQTDTEIDGSKGAVEYFKQKASLAAQTRQDIATYRLEDNNRRKLNNRLIDVYDAVTSDIDTLKEAGGVLWGYVKTADTLARATVNDAKKDLVAFANSPDGKLLKQATTDTIEELIDPFQQTWQLASDTVRNLDLKHKADSMLEYFQDLGRER